MIRQHERTKALHESDWKILPGYGIAEDRKNREESDEYSFIHYTGFKSLGIKGFSSDVDLSKFGFDFRIPIFIIQGEEDITTPHEIAKSYFNKIKAPAKKYVLVPKTGHRTNASFEEAQYKILLKYVLPLLN